MISLHNSYRLHHFLVTIHAIAHNAEQGGFWAEVPSLPGCAT
jgi:predicted RNase H-like HicB family nuclease